MVSGFVFVYRGKTTPNNKFLALTITKDMALWL